MSWKYLSDEGTWHGMAIKRVQNAGKVAIVLVFFFGLFSVIAANWFADRFKRLLRPKAPSRT